MPPSFLFIIISFRLLLYLLAFCCCYLRREGGEVSRSRLNGCVVVCFITTTTTTVISLFLFLLFLTIGEGGGGRGLACVRMFASYWFRLVFPPLCADSIFVLMFLFLLYFVLPGRGIAWLEEMRQSKR